jgi:hypothetical protein
MEWDPSAQHEQHNQQDGQPYQPYQRQHGQGDGEREGELQTVAWHRVRDRYSGVVYFFNPTTDQVQWNPPGGDADDGPDTAAGAPIAADAAAATTAAVRTGVDTAGAEVMGPEIDDVWLEVEDPDGAKYYYHRTTREVAWDRPTAASADSDPRGPTAESASAPSKAHGSVAADSSVAAQPSGAAGGARGAPAVAGGNVGSACSSVQNGADADADADADVDDPWVKEYDRDGLPYYWNSKDRNLVVWDKPVA